MVRAVVVAALLVAQGLGAPDTMAQGDPLGDVRAGTQAFRESRLDEAVLAFTRAIDSNVLSPEELALTLNNRGVAYNEVGDYARAIADYERSLGLKSDDATTLKNLRIAYTRRAIKLIADGSPQPALADLTRAIATDPGHPAAYQRRAAVYGQLGQDGLAVADLEKASELAPGDAEITQELAQARAAMAQARGQAAAVPPPPAPAPATPVPAPTPPAAIEPSAPPPTSVPDPAPARSQVAPPATEGDGQRYVVTSDVFVRARPETASPPLGTLRQGSEVTRLAFDKGWFQVELEGGQRGWFYQRFAEPIAP